MRFSTQYVFALSLAFLMSCSIGENITGSSDDSDDGSTSAVANIDSLTDVGLSSALLLTLPEELQNSSGSSLALQGEGRKSAESCEIKKITEEGVYAMNAAGQMMCHFEVEQLQAGVKYNIEFEQGTALQEEEGEEEGHGDEGIGASSFQVYFTQTNGVLEINFCEDEVLTEWIRVDSAGGDGTAKGVMIARGSDFDGATYARHVKFDNKVSNPNETRVFAKDFYSNGGERFERLLRLVLNDAADKPHLVQASYRGTWQGDTHTLRGAAKILDDEGHAILRSSGTYTDPSDNQQYEFSNTNRAFFNKDGEHLSQDYSAAFSDGGSLDISPELIPPFLEQGAGDAVAAFPATAWNCKDTEETKVIDPESEGHQLCSQNQDDDYVNCHDENEYHESGIEIESDELVIFEDEDAGFDEAAIEDVEL